MVGARASRIYRTGPDRAFPDGFHSSFQRCSFESYRSTGGLPERNVLGSRHPVAAARRRAEANLQCRSGALARTTRRNARPRSILSWRNPRTSTPPSWATLNTIRCRGSCTRSAGSAMLFRLCQMWYTLRRIPRVRIRSTPSRSGSSARSSIARTRRLAYRARPVSWNFSSLQSRMSVSWLPALRVRR